MTASPDNIVVHSERGDYPIVFEPGGADAVASRVDDVVRGGRLFVISDETVYELHGRSLVNALRRRGRDVRGLSFPAGERSKSLATASALWDDLLSGSIDRHDTIVAVGGGVTGDLAGFVASTILRGIAFVQIPTSVLAMADAAIGGKTGVNAGHGKNLIGTFHAPLAVIAWLSSLETLDDGELQNGLAEVVKSALLAGERELAFLESRADAIVARDAASLYEAVALSARLKGTIVSVDEREAGTRRLLNFGHTFAHAIEHAAGYDDWSHGQAVAVGMMIALRFGADHGVPGASELSERIETLLDSFGLPTTPPPLGLQDWMSPIRSDKKRVDDSVRLILCESPGSCYTRKVEFLALQEWVRATLCATASGPRPSITSSQSNVPSQ